MVVATGKSILNRIGIGKIKIYKAPVYDINDGIVENPDKELQRFEDALQKAIDQQGVLYEKALKDAGEESAAIFEAHQMMLEDEDLQDSTREIITEQKRSAEYATKTAFDNYAQMFAEMDDPYMKARSADLIDVETAVLDFLMGNDTSSMQGTEPSILVAEDLAPSETVKLDKSLLLGMITREGSSNSHTAILARSMNLPTLIQCKDIDDSWDGKMAILDGYNGCVYIDPTDDLLTSLKAKYDDDLKKDALLQELKGKTSTTIDGRSVHVYANIGIQINLENYAKFAQALQELLSAVCTEKETKDISFEEENRDWLVANGVIRKFGAVVVATPKKPHRLGWPVSVYYLDATMFEVLAKVIESQFPKTVVLEVVLKDEDGEAVVGTKGKIVSFGAQDNYNRRDGGCLPIHLDTTYPRQPRLYIAPYAGVKTSTVGSQEAAMLRPKNSMPKFRLDLGEVPEADLGEVAGYEIKLEFN